MRIKTGFIVVGAGLILAACTQDGVNSASADNWGEANRQTFAAQVIDPDPQYDTINPVTSGDHAAKAIDRYNKGTVKVPEKIRTSSMSGGGGSGGGGN
ncbi:hypothetical protein B0I00_2106 [Novosphingobium kunmingense]|uniref:Lipoprotein n=1 Tax=Novosphingobium kunmingense TaxID=1211806 RepID=A0A2N0H6G3_9SPHN|nr:hypothetical protein [Novosphingobium kunmingense]PKB14516.1 hypothetical protein B0I00_2106 [Novosphingobium kunmingense]